MIVLGVKEDPDGCLSLSKLSREEVEKLKTTFGGSVRSREPISHCLQTNDDVHIVEVRDSFILTIRVPQALREQRSVIGKRVADEGTYRRNDSGDFLLLLSGKLQNCNNINLLPPELLRPNSGCTKIGPED